MSATTTLILGGGFGGLAAARTLRSLLPAEHRIVLIDRAPAFAVGATKTWVMLGTHGVAEVSRPRTALVPPGMELLEAEITAIDPATGEVSTDRETLTGDYLVIALGADLDLGAVPGLAEAAESFYTMEGAVRLRGILQDFESGEILFLIPRKPFKCPPAPYEAAMLLHEVLEERGLRERVGLSVYTFEGMPMATAGTEFGAFMREELSRRGIGFHPKHTAQWVDAATRTVHFAEGGEARYDLLLAVPPHVAPRVVREAGLTGPGGWIRVDPHTLRVEGVDTGVPAYAIGDVTSVPLPGRYQPDVPLVLPKAGIMAAAHGRVVAERIAADVRGEEPTAVYDGHGFCFIETSRQEAVQGGGDFFELPHPQFEPRAPDAAQHRAKLNWVREWLEPVVRG